MARSYRLTKGLTRRLSVVTLAVLCILLIFTYSYYERVDYDLIESAARAVSDQYNHHSQPIPLFSTPGQSSPLNVVSPRTPYTKSEYVHPHSPYKRIEYIKAPSLNHTTSDVTVLILVNIGQQHPYGRERGIKDLFATLESLYHHQSSSEEEVYSISMGFLSNSNDEFKAVTEFFDAKADSLFTDLGVVSKVSILTNPDLEANVGFDRDSRQRDDVQRFRRRLIAKNRNFLTLSALKDEEYLLFLDADVVSVDKSIKMLSTFVKSNKDIIVPRIEKGWLKDYDKNSWRGIRTKPDDRQLVLLDQNKYEEAAYVPRDVNEKMFHFQTFLDEEEYKQHHGVYDYNVELDSVGGAVLFSKSIVFKLGAIFPTSYIIGTTWDRPEGYDGIETEGLCYLAKPLGFKCWGYPNIVAHHADDF